MSFFAALALVASASSATLPSCSWDRPGVNPFMGNLVAAVDRYTDIPAVTRAKLKARMTNRTYDEIALITRNGISGQATYAPEIRDMHFGSGSVCRTVTRTKWQEQHQERGLVYCEDGHCLIVPTVCRNLSRIARLGPKPVAGAAQEDVVAVAPTGPETPLEFEPPAAGAETAPDSFARANQPVAPMVAVPVAAPGVTPALPGAQAGAPLLPPVFAQPPGLVPLPPGQTQVVPEPGTWALMALGLLALRRRITRA